MAVVRQFDVDSSFLKTWSNSITHNQSRITRFIILSPSFSFKAIECCHIKTTLKTDGRKYIKCV